MTDDPETDDRPAPRGHASELATALAALTAGRPVVLLAAQPLLVAPARGITAEVINLMARHGRGLICHAMEAGLVVRLGLSLLPAHGGRRDAWRFASSYEAAQGCTTGISAGERAHTMNAAAAPGASPADIVQPGHVIPVLGDPGGATPPDLALRLAARAGLQGGAAICTILDAAGEVADRATAAALADRLDLAAITPGALA